MEMNDDEVLEHLDEGHRDVLRIALGLSKTEMLMTSTVILGVVLTGNHILTAIVAFCFALLSIWQGRKLMILVGELKIKALKKKGYGTGKITDDIIAKAKEEKDGSKKN